MPRTGRRWRRTTQRWALAAIGFTKSSRRVIEPVGKIRERGRSCPPSARQFERTPRLRTTGNGSRGGLGHPARSMPREPMKSKLVLLGDDGVGKTSLVRRLVVDQYSNDYITTVGTKVSKRRLSLGSALSEVEMVMQIWDVLGQKGYSGVQETAIKGAQGVLRGYDGTNDESRRALEEYWIPAVWRLTGRIPMVFVGNKSALVADRVWSEEYLYFLSPKYTCPGILASAKTGDHLETAVQAL